MLKLKPSKFSFKRNIRKKESFNFLGIKNDPLVKKMVNLLMRNGKRPKAEKVLSKVFSKLDKDYPGQALYIFYFAVFEAKRDIGIRLKPRPKKRRNVTRYNVYLPHKIGLSKGLSLGMRCLLKASGERSISFSFSENLGNELVQASQGKGEIVLERYNLNDLADSNKRRVHLGVRRIPRVNPTRKSWGHFTVDKP